jgi:hypothetical protein
VRAYKAGKLQPTLFVDQNELTVNQQSFSEYQLIADKSVLVLIGPKEPFSAHELQYLKRFLVEGGLVLLADDFGYGNQILSEINVTTRFSEKLLLDLSFEKNASFVHIFEFPRPFHALVVNVSSVVLNYASSLQIGSNGTIIAQSSRMSWLDSIENGVYDVGEAHGSFPVLVTEPIGAGEIVLFSAPSVFINSMKELADNQVFRNNVFSFLFFGRTTVVFDESHRAVASPLQVSYFFPSVISFPIKIAIVLLIVSLFIALFTPVPRYLLLLVERFLIRSSDDQKMLSSEQIVEELLQQHPSWNRNKLIELIRKKERV